MKAYHATNAKFAEFDFGRLGEFTEGCDGSAEAVATAKLGAWFADRDLSVELGADYCMVCELSFENPLYVSFEELWERAEELADSDHDCFVVADSEFNCTSYVIRSAEQIEIIQGEKK